MFVFHFYELVEQTVDQLVKRSIDWSNGQLVGQSVDWLVKQSAGSLNGQVNGQLQCIKCTTTSLLMESVERLGIECYPRLHPYKFLVGDHLWQLDLLHFVTPHPKRVYSMCNRRVAYVHQRLP